MVHVLGVVGWWQELRRMGDQASFWLHHSNIKAKGWRDKRDIKAKGTELFCRWLLQPAFQYPELSWHEKKIPQENTVFSQNEALPY